MRSALVLGIGNVLWADEGFGVRCVEALAAHWTCPPSVTLLDGGTQGLYLLPQVQAAHQLLVFDAIDFGFEPGTLHVLEGAAVPSFLGAKKMSLHQTGFQEVLAAAALSGAAPAEIVLIGVQPVELEDFGGSLRPAVRAQVPRAVERGVEVLARWGHVAAARRAVGASGPVALPNADPLGLERYEAERPSAEAACRHGDARFLGRRD